jgi:MoxR-like ATPase
MGNNAETAIATATISTIIDLVSNVWQGDVTLPKAMAEQFINDTEMLNKERILVKDNFDGTMTFTRNNIVSVVKEDGHKYEMPDFSNQVKAHIQSALNGGKSCNIMLTGPMGTGKTEFVYEIAKQMGDLRVFQINGSETLTPMDFYGSMVVKVDKTTGQNYTDFEKGILYQAFIEGTEVDANGNQILYNADGTVNTDGTGEPKVIGKPAIFFLDEFAAMLSETFLAIFNRAMQIPRKDGESRSIEITGDNNRIVKSHPAMCMFFAGNTVGTGNNGKYQMSYTAQSNKMDESTLNRMASGYKFGYNLDAERNIAMGLLNDDYEVEKLLKLRDDMRTMYVNEKVERLFSTRTIVQICNTAKTYRKAGFKNWITDAIKSTIFNMLPETDQNAWNETVRAIWNVDFMADERKTKQKYFYL